MSQSPDWSSERRSDPATLAVLAGGEGSRMGRPKGELLLGGRPILAHLLDRVRWPGPTLLVTAPGRERPPGWQRFDAEAVDPAAGEGPLRGLLTAVERSPTELLVVITVDMPAVRADQLRWLLERLREEPRREGLMVRRQDGEETRIEPFPLACRRSAAGPIRGRLARQRGSVRDLATAGPFACLDAPDGWEETWTNLNRPQDVADYERRGRA